jgi:hypothetical protein
MVMVMPPMSGISFFSFPELMDISHRYAGGVFSNAEVMNVF